MHSIFILKIRTAARGERKGLAASRRKEQAWVSQVYKCYYRKSLVDACYRCKSIVQKRGPDNKEIGNLMLRSLHRSRVRIPLGEKFLNVLDLICWWLKITAKLQCSFFSVFSLIETMDLNCFDSIEEFETIVQEKNQWRTQSTPVPKLAVYMKNVLNGYGLRVEN